MYSFPVHVTSSHQSCVSLASSECKNWLVEATQRHGAMAPWSIIEALSPGLSRKCVIDALSQVTSEIFLRKSLWSSHPRCHCYAHRCVVGLVSTPQMHVNYASFHKLERNLGIEVLTGFFITAAQPNCRCTTRKFMWRDKAIPHKRKKQVFERRE